MPRKKKRICGVSRFPTPHRGPRLPTSRARRRAQPAPAAPPRPRRRRWPSGAPSCAGRGSSSRTDAGARPARRAPHSSRACPRSTRPQQVGHRRAGSERLGRASGSPHTARTCCSNWLRRVGVDGEVAGVVRARRQLVDQQAPSWSTNISTHRTRRRRDRRARRGRFRGPGSAWRRTRAPATPSRPARGPRGCSRTAHRPPRCVEPARPHDRNLALERTTPRAPRAGSQAPQAPASWAVRKPGAALAS